MTTPIGEAERREINEALARLCGWTDIHIRDVPGAGSLSGQVFPITFATRDGEEEMLTDYCDCGDAAREAAGKLTKERRKRFSEILCEVLDPRNHLIYEHEIVFYVATATPEQIARAVFAAVKEGKDG